MISPRPYQVRAIDACRAHVSSGKRAPLIVAPTGSGKTTMGSLIAQGRVARGGRVVWLAHRRELIKQAADRLRDFGLEVGADGLAPSAPVQVTSVQTILSRREMPPADLVVLDEAHHFVSDEWTEIPRAYREAKAVLIGLTATPSRADGRGLGQVFDSLVVAAQIKELVSSGHLVKCDVLGPKSEIRAGRVAQSPVVAYRRHAHGRPAVVFASHVQAAEDFAEEFRKSGIRARCVHGETALDQRDEALSLFEAGELDVLTNVQVLTEGWDCPRAKVAIVARKVGSAALYLQMVGRVLRPSDSGDALLLDLTGVLAQYGPPDEERLYSLDGAAIRRKGELPGGVACKRCGCMLEDDATECPECGRERGLDLNTPTSQGVELDRFAWAAAVKTDKRVAYLAKWYVDAADHGHKPGAAHWKYKVVFKHFPPKGVQELARSKASMVMGERLESARKAVGV